MKSFIAATLAISLISTEIASAAVIFDVEVNTKLDDASVVETLEAGTYNVTFIDGVFDAWNPDGGNVSGCDQNGANCEQGWLTNLNVIANGKSKRYGNNGRFATPELALAGTGTFQIVLTEMSEISMYIGNKNYKSTGQGVSVQLSAADTVSTPIPAAGLVFLSGGAAGWAAIRRQRKAIQTAAQ